MKVLFICVGSRGDAEPFCSLAAQLVANNHSVDFFVQPELQHLAPKHDNVTVHLLPFTQFDFYKFVGNPTKGLDHPNPRVKFVGIVTDIIAQLVFPCRDAVLKVAQDADVMVTSALARSLTFAVAEKVGIPSCLIHLQPLLPTDLFPHYSSPDDECAKCLMDKNNKPDPKNLESYWELETFQHDFLAPDLDSLYESLELPETLDFEKTKAILSGQHPSVWIINSFFDTLIPNIANSDNHIVHVGALADAYIPKDFVEPDAEFCNFLKEKRPICVGFGSMPFGQVKGILEVIKELDMDAVFVGKALELSDKNDDDWTKQHVRQVSSLPYAWLLPQCRMMLSHGGAGVTHATLRAGIPPVIAPLMGDQFFFANLVQAKKIGARAGASLPAITRDEWKTAIRAAVECEDAAKAFGDEVRSEQSLGVERMVQALKEKIVVVVGQKKE
jgi:UDP:flavonoid glycosyltransferase YjiC (YdhE family)